MGEIVGRETPYRRGVVGNQQQLTNNQYTVTTSHLELRRFEGHDLNALLLFPRPNAVGEGEVKERK